MKLAITVFLLAFLSQAMGQSNPVVVGKITDLPATMVYLYGYHREGYKVDSCFCTNGSFRLELESSPEPFLAMVFYKDSKGARESLSPTFIAENKQITFTRKFNDWKSFKIGNSEETRILHRIMDDVSKVDRYLRQALDSTNRALAINKDKYRQALTEYKTILKKYAETYPHSFAVTKIISLSWFYYEREDYKAMLSNELKDNQYAQRFKMFFCLEKGVKLALTISDTCNKAQSISQILKRNTLLIFWFAGCAPCREELSYLEKVDQSTLPFDIVTISTDKDIDEWKAYLTKMAWSKSNYRSISNPEREEMGIIKYPTCILTNKDGVIIDPKFDAYSLKQM